MVSSSLDSSQTQSEPSVSSTVQEQLQSAPASMDIYAIANGDYSSITGIWQNSKGQRLAFDKNGLISGGAIKSVNLHGNIAGADAGSFGISFIPKGVNDGIYERNGHPNISDLSQDRLMAGQGLVYDGSEYYYKVE